VITSTLPADVAGNVALTSLRERQREDFDRIETALTTAGLESVLTVIARLRRELGLERRTQR
jgi:hypothetical protein